MNRGSRPLSGVIMSLSHIYSATSSHPTTHWLHQYLYSATYIMVKVILPRKSCLSFQKTGRSISLFGNIHMPRISYMTYIMVIPSKLA